MFIIHIKNTWYYTRVKYQGWRSLHGLHPSQNLLRQEFFHSFFGIFLSWLWKYDRHFVPCACICQSNCLFNLPLTLWHLSRDRWKREESTTYVWKFDNYISALWASVFSPTPRSPQLIPQSQHSLWQGTILHCTSWHCVCVCVCMCVCVCVCVCACVCVCVCQ